MLKRLQRYATYTLTLSLLLGGLSLPASAQEDSFDELPLNGLAAFIQLRNEYYIGALYLESLSQDSGSAFNFSGRKRMDIRVTIDKWSQRSFAKQWNQLILINNEQERLEQFTDQILAFTDLPKDDLLVGDTITIDMHPSKGTTIYLDGKKAIHTDDKEFFDILLNTWIGQRPPSSDFKNDILTLPTDQAGTELLVRYQALAPSNERSNKVAGWFKSQSSNKATATKSANAGVAPPSSDTTVTAKRETSTAKTSTNVAIAAVAVAAPSTKVEVTKPKLSAPAEPKPAAKPAPAPKPEPEPEPPKKVAAKPAPAPVAKVETPKVSAKEAEQAKLLKAYSSNVLKLTYLNTQYPKRAMDFKQQGLVLLTVKINRKGKLIDIIETTTSEHKLLNNAARKAIKSTAPYPEVPNNLEGEEISVDLPFNFKL